MSNHFDDIEKANKGMKLLLNKVFYFYGVFNHKFKIDELVFEVLEDPDDGYRSHLGAIVLVDDKSKFQRKPIAEVTMVYEETQTSRFYKLVDINQGHVWLKIGTDYIDDYYPYFVFKYTPNVLQTEYLTVEDDYQSFTERYPELILKAPEWFNKDLQIKFDGY